MVVVNPGGTNEAFVQSHLAPHARVLVVPQNRQWDALLSGRADVTITDATEAQLQTRRFDGRLCVGPEHRLTSENKAFSLPPADVEWKAYVDQWLEEAAPAIGRSVDEWIDALALCNTSSAGSSGTTGTDDGCLADACRQQRGGGATVLEAR